MTKNQNRSVTAAARLADNFSLTHKFSTAGKSNPSFSPRDNNSGPFDKKYLPPPRHTQQRHPSNDLGLFNNKPRNETYEYRRQPPFKTIICDYCTR